MTLHGVGRAMLLSAVLFASGCMLFLVKYEGEERSVDTGTVSPPDQTDADIGSDDTGPSDEPEQPDSGESSDSGTERDSGNQEDSGQGGEPRVDTGTPSDTGGGGTGNVEDTGSNSEEPPVCHDTGTAPS